MAKTKAALPYQVAVYFEFRELFDRVPDLAELVSVIQPLELNETVTLLCQMNADFRLRRGHEKFAQLQSELAGTFFDDETLNRLKARFGNERTTDRPVFHPLQILNLIQLVIQHSQGSGKPFSEFSAKYRVGTASLIMSDLLVNRQEREVLNAKTPDSVALSLMIQSLGPFEIQSVSPISHIVYRAQVLFRKLLRNSAVLDRIRNECEGFDLEKAFAEAVARVVVGNANPGLDIYSKEFQQKVSALISQE